MKNKFSAEVKSQIKHYVYRLIDPRNGNTFYVGKGQKNRVFDHVKAELTFERDEDATTTKIDTIKSIRNAGLKVIHIIHRHGMEEEVALEVEAALIDAYPGLSNEKRGYRSNDYGPMNVQQIQSLYGTEAIEKITEKVIIIKIRQDVVDEKDGDIYNAVRSCWKLCEDNAKKTDYVFAVVDGLVKEVYENIKWNKNSECTDRLEFVGNRSLELEKKYKDKRIPEKYRQKGAANPCRYTF